MRIATLIPAYKPAYLTDLLLSLRHQTVKSSLIIISDDSPDQAFLAALNSEPLKSLVADLPITTIPGPRTGAYNNFRNLLNAWDGRTELVHLLLDDDVIYPEFYARHLVAHQAGRYNVSVSRRWTALESGHPTSTLRPPPLVADNPQRMLSMSAPSLFASTVAVSSNWLGEFSNAVFRADFASQLHDPSLDGIDFTGLEDLGAFLKASLETPLAYINDYLGFFRISPTQHSANPMGRPMKMAHLAYLALAIASRRIGLIPPEAAAACVAGLCPLVVQRYAAQEDMARVCALMPGLATGDAAAEAEFLLAWTAYLGG
jgi:hypothetical protein